jgi:hypothetical protein
MSSSFSFFADWARSLIKAEKDAGHIFDERPKKTVEADDRLFLSDADVSKDLYERSYLFYRSVIVTKARGVRNLPMPSLLLDQVEDSPNCLQDAYQRIQCLL